MRTRVLLVVLAAVAVVGCGPKPATPPTGEPGSSSVALDGAWTITKIEVAPGETAPPAEDFGKVVVLVKGNHITGRRKDQSDVQYVVFETDATANPKTITFIQSDEKWDTEPVKRTVYSVSTAPRVGPAPPPTEKLEPRHKIKGIFSQDGDTAKLAVTVSPEAPPPTEFVPKAAAKKWNDPDATPANTAPTIVVHLTRVKETPEWATKPPPPRPAPTTGRFVPSTGPVRANPPTSAPNTGK